MAPHSSLLLLLFSNIFLAVSALEATECSSSQTCLPKEDCPAVVKLWEDFKQESDRKTKLSLLAEFKSKVCSLPPEPKYCCDLTEQSETTTISPEEKIPSNGTFLPRLEDGNCGKIAPASQFIFGGEDSQLGDFPFTALIRMESLDKKYNHRWNCGGNLINTRYVLTAAHCYNEANPVHLVRLGEWDVANQGEDCVGNLCLPPVQDFPVTLADFTIHADFNYDRKAKTVYNDIGLIRLPRVAEINPGVRPVCLPLSQAGTQFETPGNLGTVVGWGFTSAVSQRLESSKKQFRVAVNKQKKAEMDIISAERCQEEWGDNLGPLTQGQVCASRKGVTTCKGDSGGPLYTRATKAPGEDNSLAPWTLTGVTSFGSSFCGDRSKPAVFTRVAAYIDWIRGELKP